ncbi:amidase family protein [Actinophytocola oryzae]|uniref:Amidase n=1 Tax=Actinophytocola oryzae TaxID=502181 RepID=A0A4R7VFN3_9PSEU|nr:amidase family protein [Actinophytocola oryzae]TDV47859.1 amidase [Actinophytocola oryzae]
MGSAVDLEVASVRQLATLLDAGTITSVDLVQAYLGRIEVFNSRGPALNAVRALNPDALADAAEADRLRGGPHGRLLGIPVLVKDNIDVRGMPTTAGSVALEHAYPAADAALVTNLRRAGAVIIGKTNLTEFANFLAEGMPGGYSSLGGQVRNPYDASRSPSGSSAGSASAVAAGLAALAVGTETNGSILSPAAANSVVGVKPTLGLASRGGILPIAASQDTAGPMTRTVTDAAVLLSAMAGIDPDDPATAGNPLADRDLTRSLHPDALRGARIGVVADQVPDGDGRPLWDAACTVLREQGATLVDVDLDSGCGDDSTVLHYEFKRDLNEYLARLPAGAPVRTLAEVISHNEANAAATLKYGQARALTAQAMDLSPDSADTARHAADRAKDLVDSRDRVDAVLDRHDLTALLFTGSGSASLGALAGYPSITVPAGYRTTNRHPFGITLLGQAWTEPTLIGYAYAYEQASGLRQPPTRVNPALFRYVDPGSGSCPP